MHALPGAIYAEVRALRRQNRCSVSCLRRARGPTPPPLKALRGSADTTIRMKTTIAALALAGSLSLMGCGEGPTAPASLHGPHKAIYLIYLNDTAEVDFLRRQYPSGVSGLSPKEAADKFAAPLADAPPGVLIPKQGYEFDSSRSAGTIDPSGLEYAWVGYFYPTLR